MKTIIVDTNVVLRFMLADHPDCHASALALSCGQCVTSYDRDFNKFKEIDWKTPDQIIEDSN